jgi:hypothetical protein
MNRDDFIISIYGLVCEHYENLVCDTFFSV